MDSIEKLEKTLHKLKEELEKAARKVSDKEMDERAKSIPVSKPNPLRSVKPPKQNEGLSSYAQDPSGSVAEAHGAGKRFLNSIKKDEGASRKANPGKTEEDEDVKEKVHLHKNGQWDLKPDKIKPGKENSREVPKEEK